MIREKVQQYDEGDFKNIKRNRGDEVISITAIFVIAYLLFFSNQRYTFPIETGKIELNS